MSETYKIPTKLETYPEGASPKMEDIENLIYEPAAGQLIKVLLWQRFPDYDFIFGVPEKSNPKYALEIAFFQFRHKNAVFYEGHYFDIDEAVGMLEGFKKIVEISHEHSPHLWTTRSKLKT